MRSCSRRHPKHAGGAIVHEPDLVSFHRPFRTDQQQRKLAPLADQRGGKPKTRMNLDYVKCNLCGHDNAERLFEQRDSLTGCATQFPVVKCKDCGLVYVNPRPSVGDMHAFYPKDFVSYQFELFHSKQLSLRERLLSFVTKSTAVHRVDLVRRLLAPDPNLNVLDLGCGRASFLY